MASGSVSKISREKKKVHLLINFTHEKITTSLSFSLSCTGELKWKKNVFILLNIIGLVLFLLFFFSLTCSLNAVSRLESVLCISLTEDRQLQERRSRASQEKSKQCYSDSFCSNHSKKWKRNKVFHSFYLKLKNDLEITTWLKVTESITCNCLNKPNSMLRNRDLSWF